MPFKKGYKFLGWQTYRENGVGSLIPGDSIPLGSIGVGDGGIVVAQWELATDFTITVHDGETLQEAYDELAGQEAYGRTTKLTVITEEGVTLTPDDFAFLNTQLTALAYLDLSLIHI